MFIVFLIPFSALSWFLGIAHGRSKSPAKWGFLLLLLSTIPLEAQGLVIFITAFFVLGFLYAQEGGYLNLWKRLRSSLGSRGKEAKAEEERPREEQPRHFEYKQYKGSYTEEESQAEDQAEATNKNTDNYKDEVRRRREEEMKRDREQK